MSAQRRIWRAGRPVNLMQSWSTWRRGTGDPSYRVDAGAHWRALGTPAGAATLRAQVEHATEWVKAGGTLAQAFGEQPLLPELALQMIEVGEQAGNLDSMLLKVADVFDVEAKRGIDRMLAALVPSLTVIMAIMVAVIMLAIMLPLMSLTSNI